MPFPFSFVFSVPGIANPFTPIEAHHSPSTVRAPSPASTSSQGTKKPKLGMSGKIFSLNRPLRTDSFRRRPPTPCLEPPQPTSRKRGWVPSSSEPSIPTTLPATVQTSASSCLSPSPSNIGNDMQVCSEQHHEDDMEADLPPPKRRKTLAGSIVSTALSAALIGTAVGLTVYRLWKGKGKQIEVPPPPYEQGQWISSSSVGHDPKADEASGPHYVPVSQPDPCEFLEPSVTVTSPVQRRRQRHAAGRRTLPRQRKVHPRTQPTYAHTFSFSPPQHSAHVPAPQINFDSPNHSYEEEPEADTSDQMDWIGDRLAQLIEEGKRALSKEIVIIAETEEDEEDDGSGQWIEDEESPIPSSSSGSFRKSHHPRDSAIASPPPQYSSPRRTPRTPNNSCFDPISRPGSTYSSPRNRARADSVDSLGSILSSPHHEDGSAWQSSELREAMERARQSYLQRGQMAS